MALASWRDIPVLVVGGGKSGLAAARFLTARGARVTISDTRPAAALNIDLPVIGQHAEAGDGFDVLVQSPGVPLEIPLLERARLRGARIIGEVELASPYLKGRIVADTGSNGKTTTTALIGHIFERGGLPTLVAGNIGTAVTEIADQTRDDGWTVLELSSFQLETIESFHADIALVLNITPDHLDRHHTMERYINAKARLVASVKPAGVTVLNAADPITRGLASRTPGRIVWFNVDQPAADSVAIAEGFIWLGFEQLMPIASIPLPGRHNVENAMAAAAAAWLAGIASTDIASAVACFQGVEHRIQFVRELGGVRYYNDSKATNVDACEKALDAFQGNLWIILGGKDKQSDYRPLAARLAAKAKQVLLIGAAAPIIREQLETTGTSLPLLDCGTLEVAIRTSHRAAAAGDIVLLSPACASFDQFQSYEHRGKVFQQLVAGL